MASALTLGVVDNDFYSLIWVSAVADYGRRAAGNQQRLEADSETQQPVPGVATLSDRDPPGERPRQLFGHVVICGLGQVGSMVARELHEHKVPFVAVDLDQRTLAEWRICGYRTVQGSADRAEVLRAARVPQAGLLVITTGDPVSVELTAQHALDLQPTLDIVARVRARTEGEDLQHMGVQEVVWPEMEAGLEVLRHALSRYRTPDYEVDRVVYQLRERLSFGAPARSPEYRREGQDGNRPPQDGAPQDAADVVVDKSAEVAPTSSDD